MHKGKEIAVLKAYTESAIDIKALNDYQRKHLKACIINAAYKDLHISMALQYLKDLVKRQLNIII